MNFSIIYCCKFVTEIGPTSKAARFKTILRRQGTVYIEDAKLFITIWKYASFTTIKMQLIARIPENRNEAETSFSVFISSSKEK